MTRLRRLAMKVSCGVVRLAPPEAREWARATAREIEFIEGDWAALRWALGGLRILWQPSEHRLASLADVPQAARQFAKEIRKRTVIGCAACIYLTFWLIRTVQATSNPVQGLGSYLSIVAMLYMVAQLMVRRGSRSLTEKLPTSPSAYRAELKRQRDFHQGMWLWSRIVLLVPGYMLFCWGQAMAKPASAKRLAITAAVFLALCVLGIPNNRIVARRYQRRIDELDEIERNEV
jgi:hypothetical protein